MKNAFKFPFLALVIALSVAACKGNKAGDAGDTSRIDSSSSVKTSTDTSIKTDTPKMGSDSTPMKPDTTTKTIKKTTETKKTVVKKNQ